MNEKCCNIPSLYLKRALIYLINVKAEINKRGGLNFFITWKMQGGGQSFLLLAKLRGVGIYKTWKNNKRDPSFIS